MTAHKNRAWERDPPDKWNISAAPSLHLQKSINLIIFLIAETLFKLYRNKIHEKDLKNSSCNSTNVYTLIIILGFLIILIKYQAIEITNDYFTNIIPVENFYLRISTDFNNPGGPINNKNR